MLVAGVFVILPYLLEQVAYSYFTGQKAQPKTLKLQLSYGWEYLWDVAHFVLLIFTLYTLISTPFHWTYAIGLLLFNAGVGLRCWALRELAEFYRADLAIFTEHRVISSGPYALIRHPLHFGTDLQIIGMGFFAPLWLALPAIGISLWLTVRRNRAEDRLLLEHLGAAYRYYYLHTWDVIDLIFWRKQG